MLLSHKYKFIFIKTYKTAGTSVEVELSKVMGENDIVTPIIPPYDGHVPRNHKMKPELLRKILRRPAFYNHMPATSVRSAVGDRVFGSYFKFCVEREPVSKCISHYSMLKNSPDHNKSGKSLTWEDYVSRKSFPVDHNQYIDANGTLLVDRILPYEDLSGALTQLASELGFSFAGLKAKAKSGFREEIPVSDKDREAIYEAFSPSLPYTGYSLS